MNQFPCIHLRNVYVLAYVRGETGKCFVKSWDEGTGSSSHNLFGTRNLSLRPIPSIKKGEDLIRHLHHSFCPILPRRGAYLLLEDLVKVSLIIVAYHLADLIDFVIGAS